MDPFFQDERISAFLDGQLPGDERARFEDELARNSDLRQVVEELRGLHDSLRALPRQTLNDDFAQHVLRRAERAMLSGSGAAANGDAANGNGTVGDRGTTGSDLQTAARGAGESPPADAPRSRRPWIWAAVAIAVAILLMVFNPPAKKHDEVARTESQPRVPQSGKKLASPMAEPKISAPGGAKHALRKRVAEPAAPTTPQLGPRPNVAFGGRNNAEREAATAESPALPAPAIPQGAVAGNAASTGKPVVDGSLDRRSAAKSDGELGKAGGGTLTLPGTAARLHQGIPPSADSPAAPGPLNSAATADRLATNKGAAAAPSSFNGVEQNQAGGGKAASQPDRSNADAYDNLPAGEMIVGEWVTPTEASQVAFQKLLDRRGITINESPAANLALMSAVQSASAGKVVLVKPVAAAPKLADGAPVPQPVTAQSGKANLESRHSEAAHSGTAQTFDVPAPAAGRGPLEVVYVVGTRDQVLGLIDDMHDRPAQYRRLALAAVVPDTGVRGQGPGARFAAAAPNTAAGRKGERAKAAEKTLLSPDESQRGGVAKSAVPAPAAPPPAAAARSQLESRDGDKSAGTASSAAPAPIAGESHAPNAAAKKPTLAAQQNASKPAAADAGGGKTVGGEPVVEQAAPALSGGTVNEPAASPAAPAAEDSESTTELAVQPTGSGWAARMKLPPETEDFLRRSLAEREQPPLRGDRQLKQQSNEAATGGAARSLQREKADKTNSTAPTDAKDAKQQFAPKAPRPEGNRGNEQIQAVFVFRVAPPSAPAAAPAAAPAKAGK